MREEGQPDAAIIEAAQAQNLFQYPTTSQSKRIARTCLLRLDALPSETLVSLLVNGTPTQARQVNLYAVMRTYNIVYTFMVEEIGERYKTLNYSFAPMDMNAFFTRYQTENEAAATWSESTVKRLKTSLMNCLIEAELIQKGEEKLIPILLDPDVEDALQAANDTAALTAFNCVGW